MVATRDTARSYAMIYAPVGRTFRVQLGALQGDQLNAWWYNPRTGEATSAGTFASEGARAFTPPEAGEPLDWILVLDDAAKDYPPPGTPLPQ
jgi:hypothetical protein